MFCVGSEILIWSVSQWTLQCTVRSPVIMIFALLLKKWTHFYFLLLHPRCRGRGDGVLPVRDRGSTTVTQAPPSHPLPRHARDPQHTTAQHKTDELRRRGASRRGRGEDAANAASPSTQTFSTSSCPHTITWKMHLSGSLWAEALVIRRSVKTLKLREWFILFL